MTDLQTLGRAKCAVANSTRDGKFSNKSWGNLPVVVLIGDDLQLQSVQKGTLFMPVGPHEDRAKSKLTSIERRGQQAFLEAAKDVMQLGTIKRQEESDKDYARALHNLRYDKVDDLDYNFLKQFHIQGDNWDTAKIAKAKKNAAYAFTTRREVRDKNLEMLQNTSGPDNPVARIRC